jgi:hypothetical protein
MSRRADPGRPLTPGERALIRDVFGDAIDCGRVRLHHRKWWPFQPRGTVMAPDGHLWFHPGGDLWRVDFARADIALQGLFVHEMVHVWQHQSGIFLPLSRHPFCRYAYRLVPGRRFGSYGLEQQAEIVRHAWLARRRMRGDGKALAALLPFAGWA